MRIAWKAASPSLSPMNLRGRCKIKCNHCSLQATFCSFFSPPFTFSTPSPKLQRMLRERAQVGDEYVPVDALQACYIEEEEEEEEEIDAERLLQQGMSGEDVAAMVSGQTRGS
eukprot:1161296-Pelagomonas_calceolata.AAC.7